MNRLPWHRATRLALAIALAAHLAVAADLPLGHRDFVPSATHPVGYRGDNTGVFPGATPPTQWDSTGKGVLWRVTMPHETMASPIVVGKRVITLADPHTILAYDADTGKRLWYNAQDTFDLVCKDPAEAKRLRRLYDLFHRYASFQDPKWGGKSGDPQDVVDAARKELEAAGIDLTQTYRESNHQIQHPFFEPYGLTAPSCSATAETMATPVSDGTSVWVLWSATHALACYDVATGKCRWMRMLSADLPAGKRTAFDGLLVNSPLLVDGVLVLQHGSQLSGYDPATGKTVWEMPIRLGKYASETPATLVWEGTPAVLLYDSTVVAAKTGKVLIEGAWWTKASKGSWGTSPVVCGDIHVQLVSSYGEFSARRLKAGGYDGLYDWIIPKKLNEDTSASVYYDGLVYLNDHDGSAVLDPATGAVTDRGISGPNGHYPGIQVAGKYLFNFDGVASCTVSTLGVDGKLVSINHLLPGYSHTKALWVCQGHGARKCAGFTPDWWTQVEAAREAGIIGWVGRKHALAVGEMSAGTFFQGDRIYLRTHTELICIGAK